MKHYINSEEELKQLKATTTFSPLDIIVHKPLSFAQITGAFRSQFTNAVLVPVQAGTECYTINGTNTSVIKSIGDARPN